jgi:hypothetical protein
MPNFLKIFFLWVGKKFGATIGQRTVQFIQIATFWSIVLSMLLGLFTALQTSLDLLKTTAPEVLLMVGSWVLPSNATACVLTVSSARFLKFMFTLKYKQADRRLRVMLDTK